MANWKDGLRKSRRVSTKLSPTRAVGRLGFTGYGENGRLDPSMPTHLLNTTNGYRTVHEGEKLRMGSDGKFEVIPAHRLGGQENLRDMERRKGLRGYQFGTPSIGTSINFGEKTQDMVNKAKEDVAGVIETRRGAPVNIDTSGYYNAAPPTTGPTTREAAVPVTPFSGDVIKASESVVDTTQVDPNTGRYGLQQSGTQAPGEAELRNFAPPSAPPPPTTAIGNLEAAYGLGGAGSPQAGYTPEDVAKYQGGVVTDQVTPPTTRPPTADVGVEAVAGAPKYDSLGRQVGVWTQEELDARTAAPPVGGEAPQMEDYYRRLGMGGLADYARGTSQVDRTLANRYMQDLAGQQEAARTAYAQRLGQAGVTGGALTSALAQFDRQAGIERSQLAGELATSAQQRSFEAMGELASQGLYGKQQALSEAKFDYQQSADKMATQVEAGDYGGAAQTFKDTFGTDIDMSKLATEEGRTNFVEGMDIASGIIASGVTNFEDAWPALEAAGVPTLLGMDKDKMGQMYDKMVLGTDPVYRAMNAIDDSTIQRMFPDMSPEDARAAIGKMHLTGGFKFDENGNLVVDWDTMELFGAKRPTEGDVTPADPNVPPDITGQWEAFDESQQGIPEEDRLSFNDWRAATDEEGNRYANYNAYFAANVTTPEVSEMLKYGDSLYDVGDPYIQTDQDSIKKRGEIVTAFSEGNPDALRVYGVKGEIDKALEAIDMNNVAGEQLNTSGAISDAVVRENRGRLIRLRKPDGTMGVFMFDYIEPYESGAPIKNISLTEYNEDGTFFSPDTGSNQISVAWGAVF